MEKRIMFTRKLPPCLGALGTFIGILLAFSASIRHLTFKKVALQQILRYQHQDEVDSITSFENESSLDSRPGLWNRNLLDTMVSKDSPENQEVMYEEYEEYFEPMSGNDELSVLPYIDPLHLTISGEDVGAVFLPYVLDAIENASLVKSVTGLRNVGEIWDNIVLFTGQSTKRIFDPVPENVPLNMLHNIAHTYSSPEYPVPSYSLLDSFFTNVLHHSESMPKHHLDPALLQPEVFPIHSRLTDNNSYAINTEKDLNADASTRHVRAVTKTYHISPHLGKRSKTWRDVIALARKAQKQTQKHATTQGISQSSFTRKKAIRIHNEDKIGTFLEHIVRDVIPLQKNRTSHLRSSLSKKQPDIWEIMNTAIESTHLQRSSHLPYHDQNNDVKFVLTNSVDENWGVLSTKIHSRTGKWLNLTNHLKLHGASYRILQRFLAHPSLVLLVTNTHIDPNVFLQDAGEERNHNWLISTHSADYIQASVLDTKDMIPELVKKVLCLPLGVKHKKDIYQTMKFIQKTRKYQQKKKVLVINNSGWGDRTIINAVVSRAFNYTVVNTYRHMKQPGMERTNATAVSEHGYIHRKRKVIKRQSIKFNKELNIQNERNVVTDSSEKTSGLHTTAFNPIGRSSSSRRRLVVDKLSPLLISSFHSKANQNEESLVSPGIHISGLPHKLETAQARYALCPSGLGFDTYRLWETLLLGTIPIVESNIGFDRTYSTLPVLVVRNFSQVTPKLLYDAYPCFTKHAADWNYAALTMQYWLNLVDMAVDTAGIEHITALHPIRNKYCDFLDYNL